MQSARHARGEAYFEDLNVRIECERLRAPFLVGLDQGGSDVCVRVCRFTCASALPISQVLIKRRSARSIEVYINLPTSINLKYGLLTLNKATNNH